MNASSTPLQQVSSEYLARLLQDVDGSVLADAKEQLKRQVILATVDQALAELGTPENIARRAIDHITERDDVIVNATLALKQRLLARVATGATELLADAEAAGGAANDLVHDGHAALRNAAEDLRARLLRRVVDQTLEALADAGRAAEEAYEHVREEQEPLPSAKEALKAMVLRTVVTNAVHEIGEEVKEARQQQGEPSVEEPAPEAANEAIVLAAEPAFSEEAEASPAPEEAPGLTIARLVQPEPPAEEPEPEEPDAEEPAAEEAEAEIVAEPDAPQGGDGWAVRPRPEAASDEEAEHHDDASGFFVYGIVDGVYGHGDGVTTGLNPADIRSHVASTGSVFLVRHGALQVLVSAGVGSGFSAEAFEEQRADAAWEQARRAEYAAVLQEAAEAGAAVVALPFGTVCDRMRDVDDLLAARHDAAVQRLEHFQSRHEWHVNIYADLDQLRHTIEEKESKVMGLLPSMISNQILRTAPVDEDIAVIVESCTRGAHHDLSEAAGEGLIQLMRTATHVAEGEPVMQAAYLAESAGPLAEVLERLRARHAEDGFSFELEGPFQPHSFEA